MKLGVKDKALEEDLNKECPEPEECLDKDACRLREINSYPLCAVNNNEVVKIVRASGGKGVQSKLAEMGLCPGSEIKAISNLGGPMIVEVKGSRLSIGRGLASKIMVEK